MKKIFLTVIAILTSAGIFAQSEVSAYSPGVTAEGVTYFLPKTMLRVTVTAEKTTYIPGEFCRYAERYLKMTGLSNQEETKWSITGIEVKPVGVPDATKAYSIRLNDKSAASNVRLTPEGILASVNAQVPSSQALPETTNATASVPVNPRDYLTEEILMAGSTAKMAELTAREIFDIRESRNAITRGQADYVPSDGESFRYILESLDKQEKAMLLLFTGTTTTTVHTESFDFMPNGSVKDTVLFRMSSKLGPVSADNLAGEPVYLTVRDMNQLSSSTANISSSKKESDGIKYRVPGRASVKVATNRQTYFNEEMTIAQFGNIETLSSKLLVRKPVAGTIIFNTTTGNIESISSPTY